MAVQNVARRANYNANKVGYYIPGFTTYSTDDISTILDAYGNSVLDGTIPEYNDTGKKAEKEYIYDVVADRSSMNRDLVEVVMYELYWAVNGNPPTLQSDMILRPAKFKENQKRGYTNAPDTANSTKGAFDSIRDSLKTILIIGIIGVGAYALISVSSAVKAVKQ